MGNRASISIFEQTDFRTRETVHCIQVCDEFSDAILYVAREAIDQDDLEILKYVIEAKHQEDAFGSDCQVIEDVLNCVVQNKAGMTIAGNHYHYRELKETLDYDVRFVFSCPKCGWESTDDADWDIPCVRYGCDGHMSEQRNEWYEV